MNHDTGFISSARRIRINGFNITDVKNQPHVVEGDNTNDLTIYFETQTSRQTYLDMPVEHPERDLSKTLSNPTSDYLRFQWI